MSAAGTKVRSPRQPQLFRRSRSRAQLFRRSSCSVDTPTHPTTPHPTPSSKLVLSGNSKFLAMLFSSLGAGGVATVGGLAATGNLYNALKLLLEGAEAGGGGERVTRRLTQRVDTTADQILAKLSAAQQVRRGRPAAPPRSSFAQRTLPYSPPPPPPAAAAITPPPPNPTQPNPTQPNARPP